MSNYANCPTSDIGIHKITYNRFLGIAYCIECGYKLHVLTTGPQDAKKGEQFRKSDMARGFRR